MENCEIKTDYKPTNWDKIRGYKQKASVLASQIEPLLQRGERISWDDLKKTCKMNATLWKLLLKEFHLRGYDIGNSASQFLSKKS